MTANNAPKIYILKYITTDDNSIDFEIEECRYFNNYKAILTEWLINCACEIQEIDDSGVYINYVLEVASLEDNEYIPKELYDFDNFQEFLAETDIDDLDNYIQNLDEQLKANIIPEILINAFPEIV